MEGWLKMCEASSRCSSWVRGQETWNLCGHLFYDLFLQGWAKTLAVMTGSHPMPSEREGISLFWTFNRLDNSIMALTSLFRSFNWVGHLYYGLDNLLKVCVLNVCTIHTFSVGYGEIIYSVQGGLKIRTGVQGNALKYTSSFNNNFF